MSYPVITKEQAMMLNRKAATLSPELFWSCNYEPAAAFAISADGRFLASIQDLYKFSTDSGGMLKRFRWIVSRCPKSLSDRADDALNTVAILRHTLDHNNSPANGAIEERQLSDYLLWVKKVIGKDAPESLDDFELMNTELDKLGQELLSVSDEMIQYAIDHENNGTTVEKWRDAIIGWYTKSHDIYEGLLINAYLARAVVTKPNIHKLPLYELKRKTKNWIISRPATMREEVNKLSANLQRIKPPLPTDSAEKQQKYQQTISLIERMISDYQEEIACYPRGEEVSAFYKHLEAQLKKTLSILLASKESFSLLPDDFLQRDIKRIFDGFRSPDNDFK